MNIVVNSSVMRYYVQTLDSLLSMIARLTMMIAILIWLVCGVVVVVVVLMMLLYRVQSLLGDKTLSPSLIPSLNVIALIAADPEIDSHELAPCTTIVDNSELHHAHEQMELLDLFPSIVLDHCVCSREYKNHI